MTQDSSPQYSPFLEIDRREWAALAGDSQVALGEADIERIRGLGDRMSLDEVREVYMPISRLLWLYQKGAESLNESTRRFLDVEHYRTPFVIGIAGSVAVGKSTVARLLTELLRHWPGTPRVELVTTDGFLYPNAELERRGLMARKGFPESFDRRALLRFLQRVKSGVPEVRAPKYSHLTYDILQDDEVVVRQPDILVLEGLNVLQPPATGSELAVSDLFDFSIYVDARTGDIENWYLERFLKLQRGAFADPNSYFHRFADLSEPQARAYAHEIWMAINEPNLEQNIKPTRSRARLVLKKQADHTVQTVLLRKI